MEIIDRKEEKQILEKIVAASEEFLQSAGSQLNYQKLLDTVVDISGAKYAAFNLYNEDGSKYTTVALFAPKGVIKKAQSLFGDKLLGKTWEHGGARTEKLMPHTISRHLSLSDIARDVIPKHLISLFSKAFDMGEVVFVKIAKDNVLLGDFVLVMSKNAIFKNDSYVEIYARQAGLHIIRCRSEVRLTESEERYRLLIETASEGILVAQGANLKYVNPMLSELTGFSQEELLTFPFIEFVHQEDRALMIGNYIKRIKGEKIDNRYPIRILTKNSQIKWVEMSGVKIQWEGLPATMNFVTDITERKQAESTLKASEERYHRLFSSVGEGIVLIAPDGQILQANPAAERILGLKLSDTKERKYDSPDWEIIRTDGTPMPPEEMAGPRAMAEKRSIKDVLMGVKRPDGSVSWINVSAEPLLDEAGELQGVVGTFIDITERRQAEEALRESEEKYRILVEKVNEAILIVQDGVFIFANHKAHELMSVPDGGFTGKSFIDFVWHEDKEMVISNYMKRMAGEIVADSYDFRIISAEGQQIWVFMTVAITQYKGKPATLIMVTNITDRKKAEEEIIHLSFHDHLTGLYNRRYFDEELKRLDTQRQLPLSFIMGDINGLKIINDVFGHIRGDELLIETAEILKRVCRADDILARWGGDEFVILLPKTSVADSEEIVERIKKECKKTNTQKIPISLSIGAAIKETAVQGIQTIVIDAESNMYKNKLVEKASLTSSIIFALEQALYEKSNETKEHTDRILDFAIKLGKSIDLPSHQLDELSLLATLHDIGKVAIPEKILLKKSKLTEKEWSIIKRHPEIGFNIAQSSPQISHISKSILSCHENFDGSGYPLGIKGHAIPVISRIILIVDAYDVMTTGRVYKPAMGREDAIGELKRCAGSQFDPVLVDKFISIIMV